MKMQYEEILQTFEEVKRKYPEVEKVWYEPKTDTILFKLDGKIHQWEFRNTTGYIVVPTAVLKECIEMLSTDGQGTKQQVKEKLEELIK